MRNYTTCSKPSNFKCLTIASTGEHMEQQHFGGSLNFYKYGNKVPSCEEAENADYIFGNAEYVGAIFQMFIAVSSLPLTNEVLTHTSREFTTFVLKLKGKYSLF